MDMLTRELEEMRRRYREKPLKRLHLPRPAWMHEREPMSQIYPQKEKLLKKGKVVYGHIVQANTLLFGWFPPMDYPATLVYSADPYVDAHPEVLRELAEQLYSYKNRPQASVPAEWQEIARVITDEYDRSSFTITMDYEGEPVTFRVVPLMVFRKLLPRRKLCGSLLPVLTAEGCGSVLILHRKYWPRTFRDMWTMGII